MSDNFISGRISFIHHEKDRAVIEYIENGKKKTMQADISMAEQQRQKKLGLIKKTHRYLINDQVVFCIKKTGANGRLQFASQVQYQYNTSLELLIQKAHKENKFLGYVKETDGAHFIKEIESYLFFPLSLSPYEIAPLETETDAPVYFKFDNPDKPDNLTAILYNHTYIPEFAIALQHFKKQTAIDAVVSHISPFGLRIQVVGEEITARLPMDEEIKEQIEKKTLLSGSVIQVKIKHLSPKKIVVEKVL